MIRVLLKQLLDEKAFNERRRITLKEVSDVTGISRATLNRIANTPGYNTNTETLEALCLYLGCTPCDLLQLIDETEQSETDLVVEEVETTESETDSK